MMQQIEKAIRSMIAISEEEMQQLLAFCEVKTFKKKEFLSREGKIPQEVYFINRGIVRNMISDSDGNEHTIHFTLENQFIADYAAFLQQEIALQSIQALEETEVVVMPRKAIDYGYQQLEEGEKLGRLIAEYNFIYLDNRMKTTYSKTPAERYENLESIFPNIHNRVSQRLIASYLNITPIHLSRLKHSFRKKT
jgi:CRP-like cAMP-binding protein